MTRRQKNALFLTCGLSLVWAAAPACAQAVEQSPAPASAVEPSSAQATSGSPAQNNPKPNLTQGDPKNESAQVSEIVVTAEKRVERIQDVPIAVSVVSGDQLIRQDVNSLVDLQRTSPALEFQQGQSPGGGAIIRGIGTIALSSTAEPSVGVVVDGVPQGNVNISSVFDLARVEILRGPQGMLFGKSASAGVISFVTNAPDPSHFEALGHVEYAQKGALGSDYGSNVFRGVLNIPLMADAAIRISAHSDDTNNLIHDNLTGADSDDHAYGGRARLLWSPSDAFSVNLIADYDHHFSNFGLPLTFEKVVPNSYLANVLGACGISPTLANNKTCGGGRNSSPSDNYGTSAQFDGKLLGQLVTSITAYRRTDSGPGYSDVAGTPLAGPTSPVSLERFDNLSRASQFSQEIRLTSPVGQRLEYVVGAFYSDFVSASTSPQQISIYLGPFPGVLHITSGDYDRVTETSLAGFGQATFHVTDQFRVLAGGRFTHDDISDAGQSLYVAIPPNPACTSTFAPGCAPFAGSSKINNFSWRVGAQYDVSRSLMAYATVTRGYKGPQINDSVVGQPATIVRPEIPMDYEVGAKGTTLNGRLGVDLSVFYMAVKDFQGQTCVAPLNSPIECGPSNVPSVVTKGVELDLFGQPLRGLTLDGGFIYNPVKYPKGYLASDGTNLGGTQLTNAPKYKLTFSGEYTHEIGARIEGFVSTDAVYKSAVSLYPSTDPNLGYHAHWIVGGRLGVRTPHNGLGLSLYVRNLFNEHEPNQLYPSALAQNYPVLPGQPASAPAYQTYPIALTYRVVGLMLDGRF